MDLDDDFFDEDISPMPETLEGQSRWQMIIGHPQFKKVLILLVALCLFLFICLVAAVGVLIWLATDSNGNDNKTPVGDSTEPLYGLTSETQSVPDEYTTPDSTGEETEASSSASPSPPPSPSLSPSVSLPPTSDCDQYGPEEEERSYGVVVDLGSSGSRVNIYSWKDDEPVGPAPQQGPPYWYMKQEHGVSSYETPEKAANSLIPLLDYAVEKLSCVEDSLDDTPIFLFATAGLRLTGPENAENVLNAIRELIHQQYPFRFENSWTRVITGSEEAIYDWLSVQQIILLRGNLFAGNTTSRGLSDASATTGIVDLGGGSVEVSFDPTNVGSHPDEDTFRSVEFDEESYNVYGYSYLSYGHNEARKRTQKLIIDSHPGEEEIPNPCFLRGYNNTVELDEGSYFFYGTGNSTECSGYVQQLFNLTCEEWSPCSFDSIYQPLVGDSRFVALDGLARVTNFLALGSQPELSDIESAAAQFCDTPYEQAQGEYSDRPIDTLLLPAYCFEGLYAFEMLTTGFGFNANSSQILFAAELFGIEVSWTLGAMVEQLATTLA